MSASPFASTITGIGSHFPQRVLTNDDLSKLVETSDEWIHERTGIRQRRITAKDENGNVIESETNSSLAVKAAERALAMAGKTVDDVEFILYGTCSPDTLVPSTACWLQKKLGAKKAWALDVNAACSSFLYALSTADQYIRSGQYRCGLVIGSEVLSPLVNWQDRTSCILFGDGSGAAVVEQCSPDQPSRILSSHLHSDGSLWDLFFIEAGGTRCGLTPQVLAENRHKMVMKGKEIFKVAVRTLADLAVQALEKNNMTTKELDWLIPHQANIRIIEAVAKRLDFPMEKVITNIDRYGNTSSATVPSALDEAVRDGRIKKGHTVLLDVFGAGLTSAALLLRW